MIIKNKILETYIDVSNAKDMYSANVDEMLIDKLTEKFVGVCYNSCYVIKINKIIRRSYLYMKDTLDGDSNTNIRFEADVIVYMQGEVINGCTIIKKEPNGIIHAKSKYAGLQLNIQNNMSIFKEGDVVPVVVKRVRYNVNQTAISVLAMPFVPVLHSHVYYKTTGELDKHHAKELKSLAHDVDTLLVSFAKLPADKKKIYKFFIDLLYNKSDKNTIPGGSDKIVMSKILAQAEDKSGSDNVSGSIIYDPNTPCDDISIYYVGKESSGKIIEKVSQLDVIEESSYIVFYNIILQQLSRLQTIKDFIEYYPDFKSVQQNKEIWKLYSMLKNK